MKTYSQIFTDFCNTTRLRFKTFWHGLMCKIEVSKRQQEERAYLYLKSLSTVIFDRLK